ncbi:hypothetical protein [Arthrobacter sp. ERGS1:01]|uniref:hypothetical protein n=1 Tax=Arthrobacter sp. ERGS1:01 TaxID=1704044 RepID=UPI0009EA87CC
MIDWLAFVVVAITTLVGAGFVVAMYSLGVRLFAFSGDGTAAANKSAKWGAFACFGVCGLTVLFGIYLIVPFFHK